ncbi:DUF6155 family protein [Paenibacillus donghaensis]|uniref:Uncharacterized protein n=1 Tax=Paenibacillus donghaensis TaxID=414771 RepID=A0A2Z2K4Y1_9BACL|nr:DUF6155 family protein [Paenibacillus donghaensis]ASA19484.1 hypothetical protein B9T62_00625 [Paenibacillus donghaensis]
MSKPQLPLPELKEYLKGTPQPELISIIMDCYKLNDDVKKYFQLKLRPEEALNQLFEEAKRKIAHEFYPERGMPKMRLAQAKKAITEFSKLTDDFSKQIDLMLFYVEQGVQFTTDYGDIDERFYNSMESVYSQLIGKLIDYDDIELYQVFQKRLKAAVDNTYNYGWGFHDGLISEYGEILDHYGEVE